MLHYFDRAGWPVAKGEREGLIKALHLLKTDLFMELIEAGEMSLRPGVARIVDEAIAAGVKLAVCSTSNERAVTLVVEKLLGPERHKHFAGIFAGDVVKKKKPDPAIYTLAAKTLDLDPRRCVVVEDSRNGLLAAKGAGMLCIVTTSVYTVEEDFAEADAVYSELGDPPQVQVYLKDLAQRFLP
jgi:HAD superfamily hydrolase (TIGR01509 family)